MVYFPPFELLKYRVNVCTCKGRDESNYTDKCLDLLEVLPSVENGRF